MLTADGGQYVSHYQNETLNTQLFTQPPPEMFVV